MNQKKVDWTDERHRRVIEEQRKFLWTPEQRESIAAWIGFEAGWSMLDLGCGYGYLGWTYAPYMSPGGRVVCVDREAPLLDEARLQAEEKADGCAFDFTCGDAYAVPLADESVDVAFCQTLLMHLKEPERCLAEMVRVVRPGGVVVCNEPDNAPGKHDYVSTYEPTFEELMEEERALWRSHFGRKARREGDWAVGPRVPAMMHRLGLVDIEGRQNERVTLLVPPYDTPVQQHVKRMYVENFERREEWKEEFREDYLAGGGSREDFESFWERWGRRGSDMIAALERGDFIMASAGNFYVFKGRKPEV
jgi:ubiquinone/menaquinone biosynthesis C-methylase UbiE